MGLSTELQPLNPPLSLLQLPGDVVLLCVNMILFQLQDEMSTQHCELHPLLQR